MILTKDQILSARPRIETINVPEWGGDVMIRTMSLSRASKVVAASKDGSEDLSQMLLMLVASVCDETGKLLFDEADIPNLADAISIDSVKRISERVMSLNEIGPGSEDVISKNSEASPSS